MKEISQIKQYAKQNSVPIMKDETCTFICDYIRKNNVKTILEIGTAIGYSAINFAQISDDIFVSTIEYDIERYGEAVKNVNDCNLMDRITLYLGDALTTQISGQFDLIFIDAAKAQYTKYFEKFKHNLASGGVIITDNLAFHGMVQNPTMTHNYSTKKLVHKIQKFVDFLTINEEFSTEFIELGDRIALSRRITEPKKDIFEILIEIGIYYELQLHPPIFCEKDAEKAHISLVGTTVKNLFVRDKHGHFALVTLPLEKRLDLKQVAQILGTTRLYFCSAQELADYLHITPGSVSPLCIMFDKLNKVDFLIDESLRTPSQEEIRLKNNGAGNCGTIIMHPLRNDASIAISFDDLIKFTQHFNHTYRLENLIDKTTISTNI